jgi:putative isomerase
MNYLVYQGIKRYALDAAAGELAKRSVALFLKSWEDFQLCRENYDSRTGEGGGQRYQSWGPLFALIGVEEFLDVTPWAGLTVGSLAPPGETTLRRIRALGRNWTVAMGPAGLRLDANDRTLLTSDAPVVLRKLEVEEGRLSCETHSTLPLVLQLRHPAPSRAVEVDGARAAETGQGIELSPGIHTIRAVGSRP